METFSHRKQYTILIQAIVQYDSTTASCHGYTWSPCLTMVIGTGNLVAKQCKAQCHMTA